MHRREAGRAKPSLTSSDHRARARGSGAEDLRSLRLRAELQRHLSAGLRGALFRARVTQTRSCRPPPSPLPSAKPRLTARVRDGRGTDTVLWGLRSVEEPHVSDPLAPQSRDPVGSAVGARPRGGHGTLGRAGEGRGDRGGEGMLLGILPPSAQDTGQLRHVVPCVPGQVCASAPPLLSSRSLRFLQETSSLHEETPLRLEGPRKHFLFSLEHCSFQNNPGKHTACSHVFSEPSGRCRPGPRLA